MIQNPLTIISVYLLLVIGLGVSSNRMLRRTSQDYMLASHTIGPFLLLMSLFGTSMTAFALVGSTGKSYRIGIGVYGMLASSSGIVHSLCFFLIGVKLWSLGRRYGYTTQVQFFRDRLESDRFGLLLFPILVGLVVFYLLVGVLGAGAVINGVTKGTFETAFADYGHGVPNWAGSLMVCSTVLVYVFAGGMRGTVWANAFQTAVFMVLGVFTFFVIARAVGGQDTFLQNLQSATQQVEADNPRLLTREGLSKWVFFSFMLIPLSAGMFPHLFQHWLTAKSAESFRLAVIVHPLFIMIVWMPCVLVGVWATSATMNGELVVPSTIENENAVLAIMVGKLSGPLLSGLLSAGILAAVMSSLDSQFLCLGTMFTHDIVLHYGGQDRYTERQTVVLARMFIVLIVAVTYGLSLLEPPGIFDLATWCFSGFASLVPVVVAALYWRRLTEAGAFASVITTTVCWIWFLVQAGYPPDPRYVFPHNSPFGMLPVATMFVCSSLALVIVSLVTKRPGDQTLERFFPTKIRDGRRES